MTNLPPVQLSADASPQEVALRRLAEQYLLMTPKELQWVLENYGEALVTELQHSRAEEAVAPIFDGPYAGPFTGPLSAGQPIRWQVKCSNIADEWFTDEGSADQWANSPGHYDAEIVVWTASPASTLMGKEQELRPDLATFLLWVAESYEALAKSTNAPDEIEGFLGSAEMARKHHAALARRSSSDEQAEVVAAKWMVVRNGELVLPLLNTEAEAKRYAFVHDEEVAPLYRAPSGVKAGVTEAMVEAAIKAADPDFYAGVKRECSAHLREHGCPNAPGHRCRLRCSR